MDISIGAAIFGFWGGVLFLILGISKLITNHRIKKYGMKTIAVISDFQIEKDRDSERRTIISKYPKVQFINTEGEKIITELSQGDGSYVIGQRIPIIYERNKGKYDITINSNLWLVRFPLGLALVGFVILAMVIIFTFKL